MQASFWIDSWRNREIGFHQKATHPALLQCWADAVRGRTVLVPLCGKTLDMLWLAQRGHEVVGVELVEAAVLEFFSDNQLGYSVSEVAGMRCYRAEQQTISIYVGDFFEFAEAWAGAAFDSLFDRGALVALPPEIRPAYVAACKQILVARPGGLLISFEYDQRQMQGPPFSVDAAELAQHWGEQLQLQARVDMLDELPKARASGLSRLDEFWWSLCP
jgi:thiopurine S-methyltransferase